MKKYSVKKNKAWFTRNGIPYLGVPIFKSGIELDFLFEEDCWYNWLPDKDQHDVNKLFGLTSSFSLNDVDAGLIGFAPNPDKEGYIKLTAYSNYGSDKVYYGKRVDKESEKEPIWVTEIPVMFKGKARIINKGDKWEFNIDGDKIEHPKKKICSYRTVGPWIGGANNEPGNYGGKASQDMTLWLQYKTI